jgi:glucosamine--fructose-6-phosphate aminotransferase (isomerizing)
MAELTPEEVRVYDANGYPTSGNPQTIDWDPAMAQKTGFPHFMLKEICEQPTTVQETFRSRIAVDRSRILLDDVLPPAAVDRITRVCLVACGTSYHAALVARFWFEELAGLPCDVEIASEYRYRRFKKEPGTLVVAITQSGETADTLATLRDCRRSGFMTMSLCNVVGSTASRDADYTLYTHCGPEIGVASTKAFTGQLTALFLLALYVAQRREIVTTRTLPSFVNPLLQLPQAIQQVLNQSQAIEQIARKIAPATHMLYLGRHLNYPIALEGALKMKEISYIHAEGYPAGEMKHGPIALIDEQMPVIGIVTASSVREKMLSNLEEVKARGGRVIAVITENDEEAARKADDIIPIPSVHELLDPILTCIPLQLLAYHTAVLRGCDVDQPRNLAKSVTVE